jgi:hypothetical protein
MATHEEEQSRHQLTAEAVKSPEPRTVSDLLAEPLDR